MSKPVSKKKTGRIHSNVHHHKLFLTGLYFADDMMKCLIIWNHLKILMRGKSKSVLKKIYAAFIIKAPRSHIFNSTVLLMSLVLCWSHRHHIKGSAKDQAQCPSSEEIWSCYLAHCSKIWKVTYFNMLRFHLTFHYL